MWAWSLWEYMQVDHNICIWSSALLEESQLHQKILEVSRAYVLCVFEFVSIKLTHSLKHRYVSRTCWDFQVVSTEWYVACTLSDTLFASQRSCLVRSRCETRTSIGTWWLSAKRENFNYPTFSYFHQNVNCITHLYITRKSFKQQRSNEHSNIAYT